jgi:hypothetical protein
LPKRTGKAGSVYQSFEGHCMGESPRQEAGGGLNAVFN